MDKEKIANYYDVMLPFYKRFWYKNSESYALHYGFWKKDTKDINEALLNTNSFLAQQARIQPGNLILDAGCGVGGSAIWLAKNFDAKIIGITIGKKQIQKAKELAKSNKVDKKTKFYLKDFINTGFRNNCFDVVWAIESVCHAESKRDFLKESYRILKLGGRIVVADGFLKRQPKNKKESDIVKAFTEGLALPNLAEISEFKKYVKEAGFTNIKFWDKTNEILPSAVRLYKKCKLSYPIVKMTQKINKTSDILAKNNLAGIVQLEAVKIGLGGYGVFYGKKPSSFQKK